MKVKPNRVVDIGDGVVASMAQNKVILREFPFLASLTHQLKIKSCCHKANEAKRAAFNAAKRALSFLSEEKRKVLKRLLNAETIRIKHADGRGRVQRIIY